MCEDWCIDSVWRQVHWLCVKTGAMIVCEDRCIDCVWRLVHWLCVNTGALIVCEHWCTDCVLTLVHWLCVNTGALIVSGKGAAWAGESTAEGWAGQGQWPSPSRAGKMSWISGPSVRTDRSTGPCRANLSALHTTPGYNCCQFHCCDTIQSGSHCGFLLV